MANLIQIIYISRSTFQPAQASNEIEPNVARILAKSRSNNRKRGLVGVLYFGDGCFFQCLEGEEAEVDSLYQTLLQDNRHTDLKMLSRKMINELSFPDWTMKYVPVEDEMLQLLSKHGYSKFDPYIFNADMMYAVIGLLRVSNDPTQNNEIVSRTLPVRSTEHKTAKQAMLISMLALLFSIVSLLIAISK